MRVFPVPWVVFLFAALLSNPFASAQDNQLDRDPVTLAQRTADLDRDWVQPGPPTPPLPWARASSREPARTVEVQAATSLDAPGSPDDSLVVLPLSAGLSIVSLPVRAPSEKLSELFPNLPTGSRAWIWDTTKQRFVEGFDNSLPLGRACWLYVPVPVMLVVSGRPNLLQEVSVDLEKGWNLIGVPYDAPLLRSQQHVYVDWARTSLNDAVASRKVGSAIYTLDVNGYETVQVDGSFQPLHGYWVYASGAELLELARPGLSEAAGFPWMSVLSPLFDFAKSSILTQMGYSDTAKLIDITNKLDQIQNSLNDLNAKMNAVLIALDVYESIIVQEIAYQTLVAPVQVALESHYDPAVDTSSLGWFVKQAKAGTGTSVSMQLKTEFARHVLGDWAFIDRFNSIHAAISPATGTPGILDNFANRVVLTSDEYALKDHYAGMEAYFSALVAMQIKCATMILSAYDQLGSDPAWSGQYPAPQTALDWKRTVFDPVMKAETEAFLRAAENVAVRKLPAPAAASDPPVKVPDYVQVVLGMADSFVMGMLNPIYPDQEPPGIRVRVIVNASADLPALIWFPYTGSIFDLLHAHKTVLPPFDQWRIAYGDVEYDDWILDPALKPTAFTNVPAFHVTKAWRLTRVILPPSSPSSVVVFLVGTSSFWGLGHSVMVSASGSGGTVFGSFTFAMRPSTREVFEPCNRNTWAADDANLHQFVDTQYTNGCGKPPNASGLNPCDTLVFDPCAFQDSAVTLSYRFGYAGLMLEPGPASVARQGTWKADGTYTRFNTSCKTEFFYELSEGDSLKDSTQSGPPYVPPMKPQAYSFAWQPGQAYTFRVKLIGRPINYPPNYVTACPATWDYNGANITFP